MEREESAYAGAAWRRMRQHRAPRRARVQLGVEKDSEGNNSGWQTRTDIVHLCEGAEGDSDKQWLKESETPGPGMGDAYDEISTKLRQPRDARSSSSPRSMKFASGERNDSIVLRRLRFDGVELVPDPDPDPDHHDAQSRVDDGGGGRAIVIPRAEDSGRAGGHREGWTRPSSIASAAERLRWRVLTDTTERKDGLARRGTTAGADAGVSGRGRSAKVLAAVSGGLDVDAVGDTGEKRKYDWPAPGERIGEECRGGDMREGSEREGRCIGDVGETMDIAVVRQADRPHLAILVLTSNRNQPSSANTDGGVRRRPICAQRRVRRRRSLARILSAPRLRPYGGPVLAFSSQLPVGEQQLIHLVLLLPNATGTAK
ncbi:predicted protein [Postia placenta Mad-698-R]|nr:predicted protein [Postia placenta Mad-698-R]